MPIEKQFAYHKPSQDGLSTINELREQFSSLLRTIDVLCPSSREKAVAVTNLETSAMWAIKAVVSNDPESEVTTQ